MSDPALLKDRKKFEQTAREHKELSQVVQAYGNGADMKTPSRRRRFCSRTGTGDERNSRKPNWKTQARRSKSGEEAAPASPCPMTRTMRKTSYGSSRGHGGREAALFAADLYRMYVRYAEAQGWRAEELSKSGSDLGGLKEVSALIKGAGAYSRLRYESGTHRVQRVPVTETQGRIHTSAATVAVLPEADEIALNIGEKDLRIGRLSLPPVRVARA